MAVYLFRWSAERLDDKRTPKAAGSFIGLFDGVVWSSVQARHGCPIVQPLRQIAILVTELSVCNL